MRAPAFLLLLAALSAAAPCTDYWSPYMVSAANFYTNKPIYAAGETLLASAEIKESFGVPLPNIRIFAVVLRGSDIIDAFWLPASFSLRANESRRITLSWRVPVNTADGEHSLALFAFSNGWAIGGLPHKPDTALASVPFTVVNASNSFLRFASGQARKNGMSAALENIGDGADVLLAVEVMVGDHGRNAEVARLAIEKKLPPGSLLEAQYLASQNLTSSLNNNSGVLVLPLARGAKAELSYSFPPLQPGFYVMSLSARKGDGKALLFLPVEVDGEGARFLWAGIDKFPFRQGEEVRMAFCLSPLRPLNASASLELAESGLPIAKTTARFELEDIPFAAGGRFLSPADAANTSLHIILSSNGSILDIAQLSYDYATFSKNVSLSLSAGQRGDALTYTILLVDELGKPISDSVHITVSKDGLALSSFTVPVSGRFSGSYAVSSPGNYSLSVVAPAHGRAASSTVSISIPRPAPVNLSLPSLPPAREEGANLLPLILFLLIILLLLALRFLWREKPKGFKPPKS
ncbi:MAG: carboxypeptidase-like regulatory domain-containing protein [Candidatus Micrarchaeia archaeon]